MNLKINKTHTFFVKFNWIETFWFKIPKFIKITIEKGKKVKKKNKKKSLMKSH